MPGSPTLLDLLDDAALLSLEYQLHLAEVLGEHSWRCDLTDGWLEFEGAQGGLECTGVHLLGTAAPDAGSWLWSWASPYGFPDPLVEVAEAVRYFGVQHHIPELTTGELAFGASGDDPLEPHRVVGMLTEAAKIISGHWSAYTAVVDGTGARAAFLVDHPDFRLPPLLPTRIAAVLTRAMTDPVICDHRRAVRSYLRRRGLAVTEGSDGRALDFTGPTVAGRVDFDIRDRLCGLRADPIAASAGRGNGDEHPGGPIVA